MENRSFTIVDIANGGFTLNYSFKDEIADRWNDQTFYFKTPSQLSKALKEFLTVKKEV